MYPRRNWWSRQKFVLDHYFKFGQVLMDRVYQGFKGGKQFQTRPDGMENIKDSMALGNGLIMLSAHLGGWDLAAALLSTHGFDDQIHVVEYQADGLNFQKVKDKMNPDHVRVVDSGQSNDAIFEIHQALKAGRCIGLMGDRPLADRFELIPFLGKLAPFDVTAFRLAAATRVPLLFTFGFKGAGGKYDFFARPPKHYVFNLHQSRAEQLYTWAEEYVREVERLVLRYPDQWFNFYPFWSALPVAPNGELASLSKNSLVQELQSQTTPGSVSVPGQEPNGEL
jgi:predicted LPLAT superfamily acyltransferase